MNSSQGKLIIFSAPSGSGKSTLVQHLINEVPGFAFSISATSRAPRGTEKDGVDYYFLSNEAFQQRVAEEAFLEWEEVYPGMSYGTLKSEVKKNWDTGNAVGFDIDVVGGKNLKDLDVFARLIWPHRGDHLYRQPQIQCGSFAETCGLRPHPR